MRGYLIFAGGVVLGAMLAGCFGGVAGYALVKQAEASVRRGWMLVPVVVYATDVKAGDMVTFPQISQRSVPEELVTSSIVKPDSASYVVNQRVLVPSLAGDPVLWSHFDIPDPKQAAEALAVCSAKFAPPPVKSPAEIRARLGGR